MFSVLRYFPGKRSVAPHLPRHQRGFLLIMAVVLIVIAALVLSVMVFFTSTGNQATTRHLSSKQALFIAETGVERALRGLLQEGTACNSLSYANNFGSGNFSTTGTPYNPSPDTTLSANIAAGDTVIPVASIVGYAPFGRVLIGTEEINYAAISTIPAACTPFAPPCLTGAQRGAGGTAPAGHIVGTAVAQNQCLIASTGTVGAANRTVEAAVRAGVLIARPDASNSSTNNGPSLTHSWTHTVSGTDRILIVGVSIRNSSNQTVSSVTYAGLPLFLVTGSDATNGTNVRTELWYLANPPVGLNTVMVTLSGSTRAVAGSVSLTGVDQLTPLEIPAARNTGNTQTASVNLTTTTNNAWIVDTLGWRRTTTTANVGGAGRIQQWNRTTGGGSNNGVGGAGASTDNAPVTPPGTVLVDWTLGAAGSHFWAMSAVAVRPAASGEVLYWREDYQ